MVVVVGTAVGTTVVVGIAVVVIVVVDGGAHVPPAWVVEVLAGSHGTQPGPSTFQRGPQSGPPPVVVLVVGVVVVVGTTVVGLVIRVVFDFSVVVTAAIVVVVSTLGRSGRPWRSRSLPGFAVAWPAKSSAAAATAARAMAILRRLPLVGAGPFDEVIFILVCTCSMSLQ